MDVNGLYRTIKLDTWACALATILLSIDGAAFLFHGS